MRPGRRNFLYRRLRLRCEWGAAGAIAGVVPQRVGVVGLVSQPVGLPREPAQERLGRLRCQTPEADPVGVRT